MGTVPNKTIENIEWQTSSISDVTVHFRDNGTDDANNRYMDMGSTVTSFEMRTDQVVTIEEINGFALKDPITVNANTGFTLSRTSRFRIWSMKLNVLTAITNIKIFAFTCGREIGA